MTGKKVKKRNVIDQRMIDLMHYLIANGVDGVSSQAGFGEKLDMSRQGINAVIAGDRSFTMRQVHRAAILWDVDMNWLIARVDKIHFSQEQRTPLEQLKEAVAALEMSMKQNVNGKDTKSRYQKSKT